MIHRLHVTYAYVQLAGEIVTYEGMTRSEIFKSCLGRPIRRHSVLD